MHIFSSVNQITNHVIIVINYRFIFDTQEEMNSWKQAIGSGISLALGDDEVSDTIPCIQKHPQISYLLITYHLTYYLLVFK